MNQEFRLSIFLNFLYFSKEIGIIYISIGNFKKLLEIQEVICYTKDSKEIYYLLSFPCLTTN